MSQIIDFVIVAGVIQGVFLVLMLRTMKSARAEANRRLSWLLAALTVMLLGRYLYFTIQADWIHQWSLLPDVIIFMFGPLLVAYLNAILGNSVRLSLLHFAPALGHLLVFVYLLRYPTSVFLEQLMAGRFANLYFLLELAAIGLNGTYLVTFWFKLKGMMAHGELHADRNLLKFSKLIVTCCSVIVLAWLLSFGERNFLASNLVFWNYDTVWILIPFLFYGITFYSIRYPQIFHQVVDKTRLKEGSKNPRRMDSKAVKVMASSLMEAESNLGFHLNHKLTLQDLSKLLSVNPNDLSWYLNNELGKTFYEYINELRVGEFLKKVENKDHHNQTLLALAYASGFNSKSTFNKAFRIIKGDTPSSFVRNCQPKAEDPKRYEYTQTVEVPAS